jgi:hypothetical protein
MRPAVKRNALGAAADRDVRISVVVFCCIVVLIGTGIVLLFSSGESARVVGAFVEVFATLPLICFYFRGWRSVGTGLLI